jgi:hypothetical protein
MNVGQLIAELHKQPADALVVTAAEPFGFTDVITATLVQIRPLNPAVPGVSHCVAECPRGSGELIEAVCIGPTDL